jgi:hypothetical protein
VDGGGFDRTLGRIAESVWAHLSVKCKSAILLIDDHGSKIRREVIGIAGVVVLGTPV